MNRTAFRSVCLFLALTVTAGCGYYRITSTPPEAVVYSARRNRPKPNPEDLKASSVTTPFTSIRGIESVWFQVRKEGYVDSEIIFLRARMTGEIPYHFVLEPDPTAAVAPTLQVTPNTPGVRPVIP